MNATARLASAAGAGEVLVSEEACAAAGIDVSGLERRELQLKGRRQPLAVRVLTVTVERGGPELKAEEA